MLDYIEIFGFYEKIMKQGMLMEEDDKRKGDNEKTKDYAENVF